MPYQWRPIAAELLEEVLEKAQLARARAAAWPAEEREAALFAVARAVRAARAQFVGLLVLDAGKRALEADVEVSEAIDFAEYYARQARATARALHARSQGRGGGHTALEFPALDRARLGLGCARRGQRGPAEAAAGDPARGRAGGGAVSTPRACRSGRSVWSWSRTKRPSR